MKLVLYVCFLILGHSAFAANGGSLDDAPAPAAKPVAAKPAATAPAPSTATAKPATITPAAKTNFVQCNSKNTSWDVDADNAQDMFAKILGIDEDFPFTIVEQPKVIAQGQPKACTGSGTCSVIQLSKDPQTKVLMLKFGRTASPSKICQVDSNTVKMTADSMMGEQILTVHKQGKDRVYVQVAGYSQYDNTYAVGAK